MAENISVINTPSIIDRNNILTIYSHPACVESTDEKPNLLLSDIDILALIKSTLFSAEIKPDKARKL